MRVDLITKENAITVLTRFSPKESWWMLTDLELDIYFAEGMELILTEDLIEFIVQRYDGDKEPDQVRSYYEGFIAGIHLEANRQIQRELETTLELLNRSSSADKLEQNPEAMTR